MRKFTGFFDKNGKKIYEGDVIKIEKDDYYEFLIPGKETFGVVILKYGKYALQCSDFWLVFGENQIENIEVVGNIYQNPDLFKGWLCPVCHKFYPFKYWEKRKYDNYCLKCFKKYS